MKTLTCYLASLLIIISSHAIGQPTNIDSLKLVINNHQIADSNRFDAMNYVAMFYRRINLDSALVYSKHSIDLSTYLGDDEKAKAYNTLAKIYYPTYNTKELVQNFEKAIGFAISAKNEPLLLELHMNLGEVYLTQQSLSQSLEHLYKALDIIERTKDKQNQLDVFEFIGSVYHSSDDTEKALEYYQKAIDIKDLVYPKGLSRVMNGIGSTYLKTKDYRKAILHFQKALDICDSIGILYPRPAMLANIGMSYRDLGDPEKAIKYFKKALNIYDDIGGTEVGYKSLIYHEIGKLLINTDHKNLYKLVNDGTNTFTNNFETAKEYCLKAIELDDKSSYLEGLSGDCKCLYTVYKELGNYKLAMDYLERWKIYEDLMFSAENTKKLTETKLNYAFEKEKDILALQQQQQEELYKAATFKARAIAFGVGAFAILGFVFFYNSRRKNNIISEQNKQLESLNTTKDRIFAIIGHDLRRPAIAFRGITKKVNYLLKNKDYDTLNLLGEQIESDAYALNKLTDDLLKWALIQKNVMPYNPSSLRLGEIIEEMISIFGSVSKEKNIFIQSSIPNDMEVYADKGALLTIIRNLIDNALKYTKKNGEVIITAISEPEGVKISIKDTGVGMSEIQLKDVFLLRKDKSTQGTEGEKGTGLGMHLVYELVQLNKGIIKVISTVGHGTKFDILLPSYK